MCCSNCHTRMPLVNNFRATLPLSLSLSLSLSLYSTHSEHVHVHVHVNCVFNCKVATEHVDAWLTQQVFTGCRINCFSHCSNHQSDRHAVNYTNYCAVVCIIYSVYLISTCRWAEGLPLGYRIGFRKDNPSECLCTCRVLLTLVGPNHHSQVQNATADVFLLHSG